MTTVLAILMSGLLGFLALYMSACAVADRNKEISRLTNLLIAKNPGEAAQLQRLANDTASVSSRLPKTPRNPID